MPREQPIRLLPGEERRLREWASGTGGSSRRARRARVVLELAQGGSYRAIAARVGVHPETVSRWRRRFGINRMDGVAKEAPRVREHPNLAEALVERIVRATLDERPPRGNRWTTRSLARALRVNHMLVHRVWRTHGLMEAVDDPAVDTPPPSSTVEVVGVLLDTPAAVVLAVDGTAPNNPGRGLVRTPRVAISGAYSGGNNVRTALGLLATLDRAYEAAAPATVPHSRAPHELLVFLRSVEERTPGAAELHVFFDRPLEADERRVGSWLASHPRFRAHYAPPGEAWTVGIDRWLRQGPFSAATADRIFVGTSFNESIARVFAARYPGSDE